MGGLLSYLKEELGLEESQIARMFSALAEGNGNGNGQGNGNGKSHPVQVEEREERETVATKSIKLYLAEEQQILREAYKSFFKVHPSIELVGDSGDTSGESLVAAAKALRPTSIVLGVKTLQPATIEKLEMIRENCPDVAVVLLTSFYDMHGVKALREFTRGASVGCAYLLKHTIDTTEQLTQVIYSVSEGRIIIDPSLMEGLINTGEAQGTLLKELSPREVEVLSWMAKGYRNDTIAGVLSLDTKTVERHINNIYSKLETYLDSRHPRVNAVLLYLRVTGLLPAQ